MSRGRNLLALLSSSWRVFLASFPVYLAIAVASQVTAGAYRAELWGYPDEPAHAVTSLMVHDYLRHPTASPIAFSKAYYLHYPKVAFGHWPPFSYALNAVWLFVAGRSIPALLVLQAILAALTASAIAAFCVREASPLLRLASGAVFLMLAVTRVNVALIMTENLTCLCGLVASLFLVRFLDSGRTRDLAVSAAACVTAIMTHPSGWSLLLVYLGTFLALGRFDLLRRKMFYVIAAAGACIVVPWYAATLYMTRNGPRSWSPAVSAEEFWNILRLYPVVAGPAVLALAIVGALWTAYALLRRSPALKSEHVVWLFLALHMCVFYPLATAGIEPRRFELALPGILSLAVLGCLRLASRFQGAVWYRRLAPEMLLLLAVALSQGRSFAAYHKPQEGFEDILHVISNDSRLTNAHLLLSLKADGPAIASMAFAQSNVSRAVVRAGKMFARVDWSGRQYQLLYATPEEGMKILDRSPVNALVLETATAASTPEHQGLLWQMIERYPARWKLLFRFPANRQHGEVLVYLLDEGKRRPNSRVTLHLEPTLGVPLQYDEN